MTDDTNYKVTLRSYEKTKKWGNLLQSTVNIDCKKYETFKKIIEAVTPILEDEEKTDNDNEDIYHPSKNSMRLRE